MLPCRNTPLVIGFGAARFGLGLRRGPDIADVGGRGVEEGTKTNVSRSLISWQSGVDRRLVALSRAAWFSERFSKGQCDKEECIDEWDKYRACLVLEANIRHLVQPSIDVCDLPDAGIVGQWACKSVKMSGLSKSLIERLLEHLEVGERGSHAKWILTVSSNTPHSSQPPPINSSSAFSGSGFLQRKHHPPGHTPAQLCLPPSCRPAKPSSACNIYFLHTCPCPVPARITFIDPRTAPSFRAPRHFPCSAPARIQESD
ncbi:hypothetical protein KSP40_PGU001017 [Platanthera guangdongensis]|uniref:Uncharacterized protein n=1 Tax=Platanthera guangdongensis TaxID=2320717 RepID=A0ABR2M3K1_9ASPA